MEDFLGETEDDIFGFLHDIKLPAHFFAAPPTAPPTAKAAFDGDGAQGKQPTSLPLISAEFLQSSSSSMLLLLASSLSPSLYKLEDIRQFLYVPEFSLISATRLISLENMFFLLWQTINDLVPSKYSIFLSHNTPPTFSLSSTSSPDKSSHEFSNSPQCESSRTIFCGELVCDKESLLEISLDKQCSEGQKVP